MKLADKKALEEAAMKGPWDEFENFAQWRESRTAIQKVQVAVAKLEPGNNSRMLRYVQSFCLWNVAELAQPFFTADNLCRYCSDRGVNRIVRVLKAQGWRREAGDFTVFPTAADFRQFQDALPHLHRRLRGEGVACYNVYFFWLEYHCM
jgi:hypothetical protein